MIQQARAGDAEALERLLELSRDFVKLMMGRRCRGRLQARVDNSDIVQETMLRAAQNIAQFKGMEEEEWRAWLTRIAEREVIHQLRHHLGAAKRAAERERPLLTSDSLSKTGAPWLDRWLAKSQSSPSLVAMRKERALLLSQALARLPDDHREVIVLRSLEGLDFPEIAERMQRQPGAVRVLWVRALKKLRAQIQALESTS